MAIKSTDEIGVESEVIASPCIRRCCLDDADVCVGCFRTLTEIMQWSNADNRRKQDILHKALTRSGR